MARINHIFTIKAPLTDVFKGISAPGKLNMWWTKKSTGEPIVGAVYVLHFGENCVWEAIVTKSKPNKEFEWQMTKADDDWIDTKIGFILSEKNNTTTVSFYHKGWRKKNDHFKISSYCWAMYLRLLKRYIEHGERVAYEKRLSV
jgi:uncharacterized protein YndB with AHSA1/START domain